MITQNLIFMHAHNNKIQTFVVVLETVRLYISYTNDYKIFYYIHRLFYNQWLYIA